MPALIFASTNPRRPRSNSRLSRLMAVLSPQSLVFSGPPSLHPFPSPPPPPPPPHTLLSISPVSRSFSHGRVAARRKSGVASAPLVARAASSSTASGFDAGVIESLGDVSVFSALTAEPVLLRDLWDQNEVAYSYTYNFPSLD